MSEVVHDHKYWSEHGDSVCSDLIEEHDPIDIRNILCYALAHLANANGYETMHFMGLTVCSLHAALVDLEP